MPGIVQYKLRIISFMRLSAFVSGLLFLAACRNGPTSGQAVFKDGQQTLVTLNADFSALPTADAARMGIPGGVQITALRSGPLASQTGIKQGFIITRVDGDAVSSVRILDSLLGARMDTGFRLQGMYPGDTTTQSFLMGF